MEKDRAFMKRMKEYIIREAQAEFGYAGLADAADFCMIYTGEGMTGEGMLTFEIKIKE
jgi:hypothetical protein